MDDLKKLEISEHEIGEELGDPNFRKLWNEVRSVTNYNTFEKSRVEEIQERERQRAINVDKKIKIFGTLVAIQVVVLFFVPWSWKFPFFLSSAFSGWVTHKLLDRYYHIRNSTPLFSSKHYPSEFNQKLATICVDLDDAITVHNNLTDDLIAAEKFADLGYSEGLRRRDEIVDKMHEKRDQYIRGIRTFRVYLDHPRSVSSKTNILSILDHSVDDFGDEIRDYIENLNADVLGATRVDNDIYNSDKKKEEKRRSKSKTNVLENGPTDYSEGSLMPDADLEDSDFEDLV